MSTEDKGRFNVLREYIRKNKESGDPYKQRLVRKAQEALDYLTEVTDKKGG